ncbi:L-glyceraldehyde 3-phosphate reductase, partial [Clostridium perfringens]
GDSRAASASVFLNESNITPEALRKIRALHLIAHARNQRLAQFALAWVLRGGRVTSDLIGASKVSQIEDNVAALNNLEFSKEELDRIEAILKTENTSSAEG